MLEFYSVFNQQRIFKIDFIKTSHEGNLIFKKIFVTILPGCKHCYEKIDDRLIF